jgi:hypothetical protein
MRMRAVAAALIALSCACATFHGGGYSCTDPVNSCVNPVTVAIAALAPELRSLSSTAAVAALSGSLAARGTTDEF